MKQRSVFQRMTVVDRQMAGVERVRVRNLTPVILGRFYDLPLDKKERCLIFLGDHIRHIQERAPRTAEALQQVYDDWYKTVQQERADRVFQEDCK